MFLFFSLISGTGGQAGFLVVVEIPYSKYLDCGADMFHEIITSSWLTAQNSGASSAAAGGRRPGLVIRLQGFDRGVFGGNFHTHNSLPLPPGLDVVVHSNGSDWVRGWRHALAAAGGGRVVMVVDSTDLLNRRHVDPDLRDAACLTPFPAAGADAALGFDAVLCHPHGLGAGAGAGEEEEDDVTVVTYGTGVMAARQAQRALAARGTRVGILEVPLPSWSLSRHPHRSMFLVLLRRP